MGEEKEECPCSDSSEPSNLSSLTSENANDFKAEIRSEKCNDCNEIPENRFASVSCQADPSSFLKNEPSYCICQTFGMSGNNIPVNCKAGYFQDNSQTWNRVNWKWPRSRYLKRKDKAYEVKLKKKRCKHYSKPYFLCELSEGLPQKIKEKTNSNHEKVQQAEQESTERIDIYYFDHGNSAYYRTTDSPPIVATEKCADKTENAATRFWAEIFGVAHIGCAFFTAFILQFLRFLLYSTVRPLTVGIVQMLADYFIKPFLSILFNAIIQPFLILLYNVATSFKDLCEPIAKAIGFFLKEAANLVRAFRIVEVNQNIEKGDRNALTACT